MSALFRVLEKKNGEIKEIYDEQSISGDVYMAVLDYIDECDIVFDFLENFSGNADSYALEVMPEQARRALKVLEDAESAADKLSQDWEYTVEDILYGIKVLCVYFEKLISQAEISALIFEIY